MVLTYSTMMPLGAQAPDFKLPGVDGRDWALADFQGAPALLIVFTCNHCPYAQAVQGRLIQLHREFAPRGLATVLINSNDAAAYPEDSFAQMQTRARELHYPFPYLYDETQAVARAYQAACTPDPFLFDAERRLVYRGRIDDNWKEPENVTRQDLRQAIAALLSGQPLPQEQFASMGCNIKWKNE